MAKYFLAIVFSICFLSKVSGQTSPAEIKKARMNAIEHLKYDEFQEAIPYLQILVEAEPDNAYYQFWIGKCLYQAYLKVSALSHLEKAAKLDAEVDPELHYYYALALHNNYKFDEAKIEYAKALERFTPESLDYQFIETRIKQCVYGKFAVANPPADYDMIRIRNAGPEINSEFAEHSPVISADESILIYTARRPECLGAVPEMHFYDEDLYISYQDGEIWTKSQNIGPPVNSKGHDATISLTADGRTLYIYRQKEAGGIYVTDFDTLGKKWKEPSKVERPLNSKYYEACICASPDGKMLIFSSNRPGGFGGKDLYSVKQTESGSWEEPVNLGGNINTPWDEDAPFIHPDGKTLYYSSNGQYSIGGFDIFVSQFVDSTNTWISPLNMGHPVNTPDEDIYFVLSNDGLTGYYSSGKEGGFGEKDIYIIDFPYYPYPRRYNNILLTGIVVDAITGDTLDASVRLFDKSTGDPLTMTVNRFNPEVFHYDLKPDHKYALEVVAEGYPFYEEVIESPVLTNKDIRIHRIIQLRKQETVMRNDPPPIDRGLTWPDGGKIEIMNIYYDFDKYNLRKESEQELDRVIALLNAYPDLSVELHGHTDWYNTVLYNDTLSLNRTRTPFGYLLEKGVDPQRIYKIPLSENRPIDNNDNDEGRQYNRRTEFHFVKEGQVVYTSLRLRSDVPGIFVDHATPKGIPGFDKPELVKPMATIEVQGGLQPETYRNHSSQANEKPLMAEAKTFRINLKFVNW